MRMIDADALEELFREVIGGIAKKQEMTGALEHMVRASAMVVEMINDAPTVDAVPVVHGRWQWISSTYDRIPCEKRYWCSKCHHETITHDSEPWEKFCPNCGAKMDEKGGDQNG